MNTCYILSMAPVLACAPTYGNPTHGPRPGEFTAPKRRSLSLRLGLAEAMASPHVHLLCFHRILGVKPTHSLLATTYSTAYTPPCLTGMGVGSYNMTQRTITVYVVSTARQQARPAAWAAGPGCNINIRVTPSVHHNRCTVAAWGEGLNATQPSAGVRATRRHHCRLGVVNARASPGRRRHDLYVQGTRPRSTRTGTRPRVLKPIRRPGASRGGGQGPHARGHLPL